ncbi:alpha-rhamnosidase [Lactiplantibacillus pentosus]|uniref:alpha-L-rhamnosidase-related protein n=1 Tax=Lactiplantibacillus pentosus TaxID=1589 RepID=UPI0013308D41|nr:alpha-rhamnosidase [Lactiplantibacillus pentosus]MBQ0834907.1 alpha-rhamnosidase [Lactiplantibacillus pentosus]MBU7464353.1 alpha-rhamnosidase [Lactiplantibacillus pentosus]MBU7490158.1 alpha-rhamnosidase [Lactiplantibacillus pentosus]MBU7495173.1 alpha-rhamnosidase [Lactiplantibacillus pentosus]MBU7521156.1 alpha-rhamnosidase [Lactiplantibacillus pentosus]
MVMKNEAVWLWYPGDFEIHQGMLQNFKREERGMGWPAYWYIDDCHRNVSFKRHYELAQATQFIVYAQGTGYVDVNGTKHPLGKQIQCSAGATDIQVFVGNVQELPAIYIDGQVIKSDEGWLASNFITTLPAGHDALFTRKDQNPNVIVYQTKTVSPVAQRAVDGGVLYDFGRAVNGTVTVQTSSPITLCYGESETEARDVEMCYYKQENVTATTVVRKRAFRYVFVPDCQLGTVDLTAVHEYLPKDNPSQFTSDNKLINQIWQVATETLNLCSDLFFIDGIKRDRWIWAGDAYQANFINQYSFFNEDIDKRTLLALRGQDDIKQHMNTIVDYSMLWVIGVLNHYQMTGDRGFLEIVYPKLESMVQYFIKQTNDKGFIYGRDQDWIFVDWSEMDKQGTVAAEQVLLLEVYQTIMTCGAVLNKPVDRYQMKYDQLWKNLMTYFWDDEKGAFIDSYESGKRHVTRHANIFAILFDVVDADKQRSILKNVLLNDQITQITTPYFKFFEQDALCKLGERHRVYQVLLDYWGGMLDRGAVTFWEEFDPTQHGKEMYAMYGDPYGKSLCHAWGASPIYLLGRHFVGLRPTSPGYQTFEIKPELAEFKQLQTVLPVKNGTVTVAKKANQLSVTATRDGGTLIVNDQKLELLPNKTVTVEL